MINVLFAAPGDSWDDYRQPLEDAFGKAGLDATLSTDLPADQVDYIVFAPGGTVSDFTPFARLKAVLNLWAGVEQVVGNDTLTVPLCRMVDSGLTEGMVEWVTGHVLRHHLGMDAHILGQDGHWRDTIPPLARNRRVCILGLGALGAACAAALTGLNFDVHGWSRRPKDLPGVTCHSRMEDALAQADILVLLLPLTPETTDLIDASALAHMPDGAMIINPGRGPLIDDDSLIVALDAGKIGHATLDVFRIEPLPAEHAYWRHPKVTVTPHIASATRPETASEVIAENIRRSIAGDALLHVVDRDAGY